MYILISGYRDMELCIYTLINICTKEVVKQEMYITFLEIFILWKGGDVMNSLLTCTKNVSDLLDSGQFNQTVN